ncbi:DUF559 domain-containing protein [Agromyces protaetiae]|uniref:DUF559 domain-containing protein n=1 Tax=Agromyces protaetiae TaxID=2509455 RepID=A0A4P6FCS4_9MICO|nr:DUF559 domain-containing protein [Agromyces protaetiae]QAY73466.1 DUF559 domain-containing protein [Agromyces protaetiae]
MASPPGLTRARSRGVVGHEHTDVFAVRFVDVHPVVEPSRAWCQLATLLSHADLVAAGDALVTGARLTGGRRLDPLATLEELEHAARAWAGRRGARALLRALPHVRTGPDSRPESLLRLLVGGAGFPEPVIGYEVATPSGRVLHPDLAWPEWKVALEYEGDGHRTDRERWRRDIRRREDLEAAGWRIIRVTADDLFADPGGLIARIRSVIALVTR